MPADGKMRRLVLVEGNADINKADLRVETVDIPKPKSGEVLIRVCAAPVNPSDYGEWKRPSEGKGSFAIGKEGSGIVVASGGGITTANLLGKKVGFCNLPKGQGTYSEFVTAVALTSVFPMPDSLNVEDAASFFVNPYTAYGILETTRSKGATGLVHTAAASQLGQMLVKLCKMQGLTLLNVVRREEQAKTLRDLGAAHVVVTEEKEWKGKLKALIDEHKVTVAFDAIAGEMTGDLLDMLPPKGTAFVYGGLSGQKVGGLHPLDLIYREKAVEGWLLPRWIKGDGNMVKMGLRLRAAGNVVNAGLAPGGWASSQFEDCELDTVMDRFKALMGGAGFTNKKLRIRMDKGLLESMKPEEKQAKA